jgi:hypothetical protein
MRREILDDVGALLTEHLSAQDWGRVLVEVVVGKDGEPLVAEMEVEDLVGEEARVDAAFGDETLRPLLPVIAKAVQALCGLEGVELDDVRGGTFLRRVAGGFEWLPGLVHLPSAGLESAWDVVTARAQALRQAMIARYELPANASFEVDLERERILFSSGEIARAEGRATLIGTFSLAGRTWAWGGPNVNLSAAMRASSAAIVDAIVERDLWELSTPAFALDQGTAWALSAFVCDRAGGEGVHCYENQGGLVYVLLRDLREAGKGAA